MKLPRSILVPLFLALSSSPLLAQPQPLTVSAAISLKPALQVIGGEHEKATGQAVRFNFGASGALLGQIKAGAPVDLFISAADKQVTELTRMKLADAAGRVVIARGRLALIVPLDQANAPASFADVAAGKVRRLAIGQPKTVPAGDYATQALVAIGTSTAVLDSLVLGANVRQVLDYVVRGEVDAALVYATDARDAGDAVRTVELVDPSLHEPIVYPAIVLSDARHRAAAERFLAYLTSDAGQRVLRDKGFDPPQPHAVTITTSRPTSTTRPAPTTVPAR